MNTSTRKVHPLESKSESLLGSISKSAVFGEEIETCFIKVSSGVSRRGLR